MSEKKKSHLFLKSKYQQSTLVLGVIQMFRHILYHIHSDHGSHYSEQVILAPILHIIQQTKTTTELLKLTGPHLSRTKLSMLPDISHRLSPSDSSKYSFSPPNREKAELSSSRLPKSHDSSMTYDVWAIFRVCWATDQLTCCLNSHKL